MTYACPAWDFAADNHLLKLQRLQNKVLPTTGNFPKLTSVHNLHMVFKLPYTYIYDCITKLCRQQAEVIQNHKNAMFAILDKANPDTGIIRGLDLATDQVTRLLL
jgi:hypothetical protein